MSSTHSLWQEIEFSFTSTKSYENAYTDVELWADFTCDDGTVMRRPGFWSGGNNWKIRFAPPIVGKWRISLFSNCEDQSFKFEDTFEVTNEKISENLFYQKGFWSLPTGERNLKFRDGSSDLIVADTAWALPWRATVEDVKLYAKDRRTKGFNAVLLMVVQPDMGARGPRDRGADEGFAVGFEDLHEGHINLLNPNYFDYLDSLISVLVENEIVPVYSPLFFGFGWKGLGVIGPIVDSQEYARFCRYIVARYGARPAIYLAGADGTGVEAQVEVGGKEFHKWDCYGQPTGIHYRPHIRPNAHQSAEWLDFQWCQTGHGGEHIQERVADMWRNEPQRAIANGEPSYENTGVIGKSAGWWQGHEAWSNLCAGSTMGVVYGAACLWGWRLHKDELGHSDFFLAPGCGWREALDFEGATYVGLVGKILRGLPIAQIQPSWSEAISPRGLIVHGRLFIGYQENGGPLDVRGDGIPLNYRVIDPTSGREILRGRREKIESIIPDTGTGARVYICEA
jgi:hypothetical protein